MSELLLDNNYTTKVIEFVKSAKNEVRICAYAWRWYEGEPELGIHRLNIELYRARDRGVDVKVLADRTAMPDNLRALGFNVREIEPTRMLHTKAICIDQSTLVLGSHNMTKRAMTDNYEMSIATQEFELLKQFVEYFDRLWSARAGS